MRRQAFKALAALALGTLILGATQVPAYADTDCESGHFCAWDGANYSGNKVIDSTAAFGTTNVDVPDNVVSSVKNLTGNRWCGVNNGFPGDDTVLNVAPNTRLGSIGGADNKIDHFYVRGGNWGCS
ncbi:peptidase inhibitor family I36 protein [Micromonospora okii]|uniref:peptidase inhibitor family I36 protein n=1 Tax=Micromonospora okii TaxID=1182970 RepID=UPI001E393727|nr:peptidase inhibitor family I36 protein [Micromonospora okii]